MKAVIETKSFGGVWSFEEHSMGGFLLELSFLNALHRCETAQIHLRIEWKIIPSS
jgi:hypothetical protein